MGFGAFHPRQTRLLASNRSDTTQTRCADPPKAFGAARIPLQ